MADLEGKKAIVTGGAGGYGAGIAEALRGRGADVWITDVNADALTATAERIGAHAIVADVTSGADWDRVFEQVLADGAGLDILVNNAGGGVRIAPLDEQTDAEIDLSVALNLTGKIYGSRRAMKVMKQQKSGTIVNLASVCARKAWGGWSTYSAAKAGVEMLTKCMYMDLREYGVRATTVIPSWGATQFTKSADLGERDADTLAKCIKPAELGDLVAYICCLPPHLELQDVTLWPTVQAIDSL